MTISESPIVRDYAGLRMKYQHEREISDALLELATGARGWRDCERREDREESLKPFSHAKYRRQVLDVHPALFDYSWNHLDQTQYLHWSVYHVLAEWILPPDEAGFGAMNLGVQEVPATGGPLHQGLLDVVFASWDDPRRYCGFPIESDSALLMRFWDHDAEAAQFTLRSVGPVSALLIQWDPLPHGGVELWTTALTRDPALQLDEIASVDADIAVDMPHENEESSSWGMAIRDLGRRRRFDPAQYQPVWKMKETAKPLKTNIFDRFSVDVLSDEEVAALPPSTATSAYDALWQRYLATKMLADFTLRHAVGSPKELPVSLLTAYEDFPIVAT